MQNTNLYQLRFPIGEFLEPHEYPVSLINTWIKEIDELPVQLQTEAGHLNELQLNTPYRPEGWTLRQVIHHIADSHLNSFIRFKLALTEENPTIKPYFEERWANLQDYSMPVQVSFQLLVHLHARWVHLLNSLTQQDLNKTYYHPENKREFTLQYAIGLYAWHGKHHLAHIQFLKKRQGWD